MAPARVPAFAFPALPAARRRASRAPPTCSARPSYKLGLCMAGAASGGAYSAGVVDYLWEAMFAWERAKAANDPSVPPWNVSVADITGTSAGGITAVLALSALNTPYAPFRGGAAPGTRNPLFSAWVSEFDRVHVFDSSDLDRQPPGRRAVRSLFNADFIARTAARVLPPDAPQSALPPWADDLVVSLTTTNLAGVPYAVDNFTASLDADAKFHMRRHADYVQFRPTLDPASMPPQHAAEMHVVDMRAPRTSDTWRRVVACARATAAYPIGLPTVQLSSPRSFYEGRLHAKPDWAAADGPLEYSAIDGGVLNNSPFRLLERQMERHADKMLERDGAHAWGSLIHVDPFPKQGPEPLEPDEDGIPVLRTLLALLSVLRQDAMFKDDEFSACLDRARMERFLIRPDRVVAPHQKFELATTTLGNFGGIIHEKLRRHDFELGRANCKQFLENTFVLKREDAIRNPIFKEHVDFLQQDLIPIIPIVGAAAKDVAMPAWPEFTDRERQEIIEDFKKRATGRVEKIIDIYAANFGVISSSGGVGQWFTNRVVDFVLGRLKGKVADVVEDSITKAMDVYVK